MIDFFKKYLLKSDYITLYYSSESKAMLKQTLRRLYKILKHFKLDEDINEKVNVSLSLVDSEKIRELNNEHRGINKTTDVLSFPLGNLDEKGVLDLGDVFINYSYLKSMNLEKQSDTLCFLFIHSILHLINYDHKNDKDHLIMDTKEHLLLQKMNILIEYN